MSWESVARQIQPKDRTAMVSTRQQSLQTCTGRLYRKFDWCSAAGQSEYFDAIEFGQGARHTRVAGVMALHFRIEQWPHCQQRTAFPLIESRCWRTRCCPRPLNGIVIKPRNAVHLPHPQHIQTFVSRRQIILEHVLRTITHTRHQAQAAHISLQERSVLCQDRCHIRCMSRYKCAKAFF